MNGSDLTKGNHFLTWDGLTDDGSLAPIGDYDIVIDDRAKNIDTGALRDIEAGAMTPLYDSVAKLNSVISANKPKKAQIMIVTDGIENASTEVDISAIRTITAKWDALKYDVIFLGDISSDGKIHFLADSDSVITKNRLFNRSR